MSQTAQPASPPEPELAPHSHDQPHAVLPRPGLAPKPLLRLCPFQLRLFLLPFLLLLLLLGQQFLSLLELVGLFR